MSNTLKFGNGEWYGKKDTILAYNDENSNFKPLPFSFDRASSATVVNKAGLIEIVGSGEARIDFLGNTNGALKLEPQRTNLVTYSEDLSQWSLTNVALTQDALISPDGGLNADKIVSNQNGVDVKLASITVTANTIYTYSFYCYYEGGTGLQGRFYDNIAGANIEFYDYTSQLEQSKWKRVTRTFTTPVGCTNIQVWLLASSTTFPVTAYYWGAQLEASSYPTSYIPTQGSVVTRVADVCNNGGNEQVINSTEGTLYVEANLIDGYDNNNWLGIIYDSSNANNRIYIQRYLGNIQSGIRVNGVIQSEITQSSSSLGKNKIAFTYKLNEFKMFVNGSQVGVTDTIGSVFSADTLDKLNVGVYHNDTLNFNNVINDFRLYNTALTDAELQALTSN